MFNKVMIANRGAIATRIIRTLRQLDIKSVAVYAEADADSLHVSQADEAICLGAGAAAQTYLNQERLITIAREYGVEAIHPGYGFLSENPGFAERCEAAGIVFLGPTPAQMRAFGLKHTARAIAQTSGVPLLPGSGLLASCAEALQQAEHIGFPVMLKSTAGGGGIGMQICHSAQELAAAYDSVKRLSANNFANDDLFLEKFVEYARHIEVQIFGDGEGNVIALGERDCSAQRRNQKVIEETPAPNIPQAVRESMRGVAEQLGAAVQYRSAGTVEFVYDQKQDAFYFLEVNTRLQVEHGVTEQVFDVDLIQWMLQLGAGELPPLMQLRDGLQEKGHSIQVRLYAEDPNKDFQPCAGLLSHVQFPDADGKALRIDHWIESGVEISPFFDPMLAKVIVHAADRDSAITKLIAALQQIEVYGIETNRDYVQAVLVTGLFAKGELYTRYLNSFRYLPHSIDVISGGTQTTIQDYPGRSGYWNIGVPPSGPFDNWSFRLANRLLENSADAAGLEMTLNGPTLRFNCLTQIVLAGATMHARLDGEPVPFWQVLEVKPGQVLEIGKVQDAGARAYLAVKGGLQCPQYLGSRATFTLGQFGGHAGRALRAGDVLHLAPYREATSLQQLPPDLRPGITHAWELRVIYGPHGAPDFFTPTDIERIFAARWEVHYNSSRTGIRLVGPKPEWARSDGGEAGMHPSNIHDNAYAFGSVDFTGDMPVLLGPDGPSLGGFVCPATVISADLWKLGQLKAGDTVRFIPVSLGDAVAQERHQQQQLEQLSAETLSIASSGLHSPIVKKVSAEGNGVQVVYRPAGDHFLLVEYGPLMLDINLRFRVHALMLWLESHRPPGMRELTPGIRSLQIHYNSQQLSLEGLLNLLAEAEQALQDVENLEVPARIVHLPLSWNDAACQLAIDKYMQSVRKDAPWCPSNIEFIRRINGLRDIDEVKQIVFNASYLVMGLGDVYLGAPVATPVDPRHRLVTTKYNPARTWTAENSVGIGGSYLCVYGMEGPGGYQFVGRTLQMWNRYKQTSAFSQPWLLRFFDQIRFYEVSDAELQQIRRDFPQGRYPLRIEPTAFSLREYNAALREDADSIAAFTQQREQAFAAELQRWIESGQINFESEQHLAADVAAEELLQDRQVAIESHVAGSVWQVLVKPGDEVKAGQALLVLESMKMEIEVQALEGGRVVAILREAGSQVRAGQRLLVLEVSSDE